MADEKPKLRVEEQPAADDDREIMTIYGLMKVSLLKRIDGLIDNAVEKTEWVEYYYGDELVHRSVCVNLKTGVKIDSEIERILGEQHGQHASDVYQLEGTDDERHPRAWDFCRESRHHGGFFQSRALRDDCHEECINDGLQLDGRSQRLWLFGGRRGPHRIAGLDRAIKHKHHGVSTPTASIVFTSVTLATAFDAVLIYNSTQGNKAVSVHTFGSQTVTAGTFTFTMPTNDDSLRRCFGLPNSLLISTT